MARGFGGPAPNSFGGRFQQPVSAVSGAITLDSGEESAQRIRIMNSDIDEAAA
jgi:hypothetical protein